jgi:hypothetical protein
MHIASCALVEGIIDMIITSSDLKSLINVFLSNIDMMTLHSHFEILGLNEPNFEMNVGLQFKPQLQW